MLSIAEIAKLDNDGFTVEEISDMLGYKREAVRRAVERHRETAERVRRDIIRRQKRGEI